MRFINLKTMLMVIVIGLTVNSNVFAQWGGGRGFQGQQGFPNQNQNQWQGQGQGFGGNGGMGMGFGGTFGAGGNMNMNNGVLPNPLGLYYVENLIHFSFPGKFVRSRR